MRRDDQIVIEAIAYAIASHQTDDDILAALKGAKLINFETTHLDLLRFKTKWHREIASITRSILRGKTLSGLTEVENKLRQRVRISDPAVEVAACNAYIKFADSLEGAGVADDATESANPHLAANEKSKRLTELINAAKKIATEEGN